MSDQMELALIEAIRQDRPYTDLGILDTDLQRLGYEFRKIIKLGLPNFILKFIKH